MKMDLTKVMIVCLALSASECLAQIIKAQTSSSDDSAQLVEATVNILSSCYEEDINTVGLAGISKSILLETLWSKRLVPVTLIGNNTKDIINGPVDRESRRKLQIFVVTASSSNQLEQILRQIKSSPWWNHLATFLLLDWQSSMEHGCSNAFEFLWEAWKINLLQAVYVCLHRTKEQLIYSYNPYTNQAPEPWRLESTYKGKNDHPWAMLVREYGAGKRICENLEFDKTNDLGGYEIYSTVKVMDLYSATELNETTTNRYGVSLPFYEEILLRALNATPRFIVHDITEGPGLFDSEGNDIAMDTVKGISDILLQSRFNIIVTNYTTSYEFFDFGLGVLTQHRGYASQLNKIITVFDTSTRIGLCLVALSIVIFFKCFRRETLSTAILNLFRIIANSSLTKAPTNGKARIYLVGMFILVVTILGVYQGKLSSLLTKAKPLPNVKRMQDLVDFGYTIHGHITYARFFSDPILKGRFRGHEDYNCTEYVVRDSSAACIINQITAIEEAAYFQLHVTYDMIEKMFGVFVIREDWPLEKRFNMILAALSETGITRHIMMYDFNELLRRKDFYAKVEKNMTFRIIHLSELSFAFVILGIGLGLGTVCFVVEIEIKRARSRIRNIFGRIRNRLRFK